MNKILIYDTECNDLDTDNGFIQEIAWAIYDIQSQRLLKSASHLLKWNKPYEVADGAFSTTGLTREFCELNGKLSCDPLAQFLVDCEKVDCLAGHNIINYDNKMIHSNVKRAFFSEPKPIFKSLTMIDTYLDLPPNKKQKMMGLKYLALDHGFVLSGAHEAMQDVFACAHILFSYDFEKVLEIAQTPLIDVFVHTDFNDLEGRELVKSHKFFWSKDNRRWEKKIRKFHLPALKAGLKHISLFVDNKKLDNQLINDPQLSLLTQDVKKEELPFS